MRKASLCTLFLLLLTVSFEGQTQNWKKYSNTNGNFAVLFPSQPDDSVNSGDVQSHTLMARENGVIYTVVYTVHNTEQTVDLATYDVFKKGVFKELPKCAVVTEGPPSPGLRGYIGGWYRLDCDEPNTKVSVLGNLYWGKHFAYAVMVLHAANVGEPVAKKDFLESFALIDATK